MITFWGNAYLEYQKKVPTGVLFVRGYHPVRE
jgi:hypothetical protein